MKQFRASPVKTQFTWDTGGWGLFSVDRIHISRYNNIKEELFTADKVHICSSLLREFTWDISRELLPGEKVHMVYKSRAPLPGCGKIWRMMTGWTRCETTHTSATPFSNLRSFWQMVRWPCNYAASYISRRTIVEHLLLVLFRNRWPWST